MIGMGFVSNWESMAGLRVVLGVLEAGEYFFFHTEGDQLGEKGCHGRKTRLTVPPRVVDNRILPELCLLAQHLVYQM